MHHRTNKGSKHASESASSNVDPLEMEEDFICKSTVKKEYLIGNNIVLFVFCLLHLFLVLLQVSGGKKERLGYTAITCSVLGIMIDLIIQISAVLNYHLTKGQAYVYMTSTSKNEWTFGNYIFCYLSKTVMYVFLCACFLLMLFMFFHEFGYIFQYKGIFWPYISSFTLGLFPCFWRITFTTDAPPSWGGIQSPSRYIQYVLFYIVGRVYYCIHFVFLVPVLILVPESLRGTVFYYPVNVWGLVPMFTCSVLIAILTEMSVMHGHEVHLALSTMKQNMTKGKLRKSKGRRKSSGAQNAQDADLQNVPKDRLWFWKVLNITTKHLSKIINYVSMLEVVLMVIFLLELRSRIFGVHFQDFLFIMTNMCIVVASHKARMSLGVPNSV